MCPLSTSKPWQLLKKMTMKFLLFSSAIIEVLIVHLLTFTFVRCVHTNPASFCSRRFGSKICWCPPQSCSSGHRDIRKHDLILDKCVNKDVQQKGRVSMPCQGSKIQQYNKAPVIDFQTSNTQFEYKHINIVGPLPVRHDFSYLLPKMITLLVFKNATKASVMQSLMNNWISSFWFTATVLTD